MTVDPATAPAPPAQPATAPAPGDASHRHEGGYRDTVESILIAFILAFIFRAFVVEAFVIPTGSMAPTLLGAHARFTCDDCGYQFEVNYSSGAADDQSIASEVPHERFPGPESGGGDRGGRRVACPNCGHTVHDPDDGRRNPVPIHYGDRILVLKYAYLPAPPRRWDVVVFKSPDEPSPGTGWYATNFIKRLVGNPGETLMILDGDVYVSTTGGTAPGDFKIQSKPRHVQEALWRVVCDADFLPHRADRDEPWAPWRLESGGGWDVGTPQSPRRVYTFDGDAPGAGGTIRFDGEFNDGRAFTDWLAYAQAQSGHHNVSDVKLSALYRRTAGDGPLRLSIRKHDDTFTAELSRGSARLFRRRGGAPAGPADDLGEQVAAADGVAALAGGSPVQVEFANVDHVVTLRVGEADVLRVAYDADIAALRAAFDRRRELPKPEVRITAAGQACSLARVSLWRDVYYTNAPSPPIEWGSPGRPITLGDEEYFVLGDNTVISKDARYWNRAVDLPAEGLDVEAGRVPGRFMLGKAFFVYWPAGYRPLGSSALPGLIPNFGDMRFIH